MCLGVPGRVVEKYEEQGVLMGKIDFGGIRKPVCLEHVREVEVGDYVLVHVGFALSRMNEEEANRTLELLAELGQLGEIEEPSS